MGRPEADLDPGLGPVQRFAFELRKLRQEAGGITYRQMARQVEVSVSTLSRAAKGEQLPSLPVVLAYVRACGGEEKAWERRWRAVVTEQARAADLVADETVPSPYRGLARFDVGDAELFFGRDEMTDALVRTVTEHRVVAVFGPSGSGKSSLLRAGLIPRLRSLDGPDRPAAVRILTPGEHPLRTHDTVCVPAPGSGDTWLVVDQFEEIFTLCHDTAERAGFLARLLAAAQPGSRLRVVLGVRADFYAHCLAHPELAAAIRESTMPVGPMDADALRAVIVKPAQAHGLIVERALTARLTEQAAGEPGSLPLLSHALLETWRRRRGHMLTLEAYEATGGIHAAIAQTAEDLYARLSPDQCRLVRRILLRLITPGDGTPDTRRPVERAELDLSDRGGVARVLADLAAARLVTLDDDRVDLAHESLISSWPRLRQWIEEDREWLRAHRRLTEAAQAWDDLGRDPGALYRGARLDTADELFAAPEHAAALTALERSFLATSREARTGARRRRRGLIGALSLLVVLSLVAGIVAWQQGRTSDRRHAEAEARRIAAVAESLRFSDPVTSMRLSVAAWRLAETTESRGAVVGAVAQPEEDTFAIPGADVGDREVEMGVDRRLVDNGRTLISITPEKIMTWDVRTHRRTHVYPGYGEEDLATVEAVSPDGRQLALWVGTGIRIWDVRAGQITAKLPMGLTDGVEFGPGRDTLLVYAGPPELELGDSGSAADGDARSRGGSGSVQAWDLRTERMLGEVRMRKGEMVEEAALSPDGRRLALCSDRRPLEIWDTAGREPVLVPWPTGLKRHSCEVTGLAFAPDSRTIALPTGTGIRRVDLRSGRELTRIEKENLDTLRFSADGRFLAARGIEGLVVWRLTEPYDPVPVLRYSLPVSIDDFALDPDAHTIRYLNGPTTTVRSLSFAESEQRWERRPADHAQLAQDGTTLAVLRQQGAGRGVRLLDTRDGAVLLRPKENPCDDVPPDFEDGSELESACVDLMAFSGDGRYFAYGRSWSDAVDDVTKRPRITVWDIGARKEHAVIEPPGGRDLWGVQSVALTHDGASLLTFRSWDDKAVDVWDVHRRERVRTVDRTVGAWGSSEAGSFEWSTQRLAVSRNGDTVVTPQGVIVDLTTGVVSNRSLGDDLTEELAFSPDGAHLAVADSLGGVTLWDGAVSRRLGLLPGTDDYAYSDSDASGGDTGNVTSLAFSADGSTLAVGNPFGRVQLWDVPSRRPLGSPLSTSGGAVLSLALGTGTSTDTLYIAGAHVPLQAYDLSPSHLADQACERAGGGLSAADWKTYLPDLPYQETCQV
ncbi:nSTAND1 domain-containing NTPase [Streptomyces ipomoeae]|uniref:nSTAND1 domain-containing NTPase n=1 Tax=Streptomyces ipomoeae TaxID=103232 RepID=UPI0011468502|nr:helix-turn-helix domain-containing protein [Streptomyces ipomoeae]TQE40018.1 helix-turn-helix domain-containing protein [Streptomyces ipomoeae]